MPADPRELSGRPRVRLLVFSITADWQSLEEELAVAGEERICALTPHWLFPHEQRRLVRMGGGAWEFRTFHDLLDAKDMEHCDEMADLEIVTRHGLRDGLVAEYFAAIKRLKNRMSADRFRTEFEVVGGAVLSGDLGIVPSVWLELGLRDRTPSSVTVHLPLLSRVRRLFSVPMPCHYMLWNGQCWLLVGRPERVGQYLESEAVTLRPVGRVLIGWFHLLMIAASRLRSGSWMLRLILRVWGLARHCIDKSVLQLAATVHEDNPGVALLAEGLALDYVNLQDSFLPEYYPSRYLLYRPRVRQFYVWDQFSRGIFNRHALESVVWSAYRSWALPRVIQIVNKSVRRIVYLASGAGDWTALKNRSDEDLALALLIEVAKQRTDLTIYYRPHPLWLHPEHQGLSSIQRAITCIAESGLPNIMVSQGARVDGRQFSITGNLSAVSSSVDEDIAWADLVLGEHSQTLLVAARRGKVIAGVNVSRHPAFFGDYARVGFPLVTTAAELISLVDRIESDDHFWFDYDETIKRHNRDNCRASVDA